MMTRDIAAGIGQHPIHARTTADLDTGFGHRNADRPPIVQHVKIFDLQGQGHVTSIGAKQRLGHIEKTGKIE